MRRVDIEKKIIGKVRPGRSDILFVLFDEKSEAKTGSGLILPQGNVQVDFQFDIQYDKLRVGTVVAIGSGIHELKVRDRVVVHKAYGITISHNDSNVCRLAYLSENQVEAVATGDIELDDFDLRTHGLSI